MTAHVLLLHGLGLEPLLSVYSFERFFIYIALVLAKLSFRAVVCYLFPAIQ